MKIPGINTGSNQENLDENRELFFIALQNRENKISYAAEQATRILNEQFANQTTPGQVDYQGEEERRSVTPDSNSTAPGEVEFHNLEEKHTDSPEDSANSTGEINLSAVRSEILRSYQENQP